MLDLRAYFDESGTHEGGYVCSIAGYAASAQTWAIVEEKWLGALSVYEEKGVKTFHATDCISEPGQGEFAKLEQFYRHALLLNLSKILRDSNVQAVWSSIIQDDWKVICGENEFGESRRHYSQPIKMHGSGRRFPCDQFLERFPKPYYLCFEHIVMQLQGWARNRAKGEDVSLMFALHPEYTDSIMADADNAYLRAKRRGNLGSLAWDYPSRVVPLQTADLIAHEISEYWRHAEYDEPKLGNFGPRMLLNNIVGFHGMTVGGCFDVPALDLVIERYLNTGSIL